MRRPFQCAAALIIVTLALSSASMHPAEAQTAPEAAWWNRNSTLALSDVGLSDEFIAEAPTLVTVPDNGLYVSNDGAGPAGVSAIRFDDPGSDDAVLTLMIAGDPIDAFGGQIVACPTVEGWGGVRNGSWEDRPAVDCQAAATVVDLSNVYGGQMSWTITDLAPYRRANGIEIGLVPVDGQTTTFAVAFDPPAPASLTTEPPPRQPEEEEVPTRDQPTSTFPATGGPLSSELVPPPGTAPPRATIPAPAPPPELAGNQPTPQDAASVAALIPTDGMARAVTAAVIAVLGLLSWLLSGRRADSASAGLRATGVEP